jgi:hypothetical protein
MRRRTIVVGGAALVALSIVAIAAQAFPPGPTGAASASVELPQELEHLVFMACLPGLYPESTDAAGVAEGVAAEQGFRFSSDGSDGALFVRIEAVGDWSVSVSRTGATMRNERSNENEARADSIAAAVIPAAQSLYDCMVPFHFETADAGSPASAHLSSAQLLQLYRYDTAVLWPCLTSQGIHMGDPPSRDDFAPSLSALAADPLSGVPVTKKMLSRLVPALRACPLRPAYLG